MLLLCVAEFNPASAQSEVTAIDILLNPDQAMMDSAKVYNELMQKNYSGPGSYSLDELHAPHITVIQCFVETANLEKVYVAIARVVSREKPTKQKLTSKGFYYFPANGLGLAGITIEPTTELLNFQSEIIEGIKPFLVVETDAAFVQNTDGTPIAPGAAEYETDLFLNIVAKNTIHMSPSV